MGFRGFAINCHHDSPITNTGASLMSIHDQRDDIIIIDKNNITITATATMSFVPLFIQKAARADHAFIVVGTAQRRSIIHLLIFSIPRIVQFHQY